MRMLNASVGDEINQTIALAIEEAKRDFGEIGFDFNGVNVVVAADSDPDLIYRDWFRGLNGFLGSDPKVGPHPKPGLTDEDLASDAKIRARREREKAQQLAKAARKQEVQSASLADALSVCGPLELSDAESWQKCVEANTDPYGGRVVRFAEEWGRLMQVRIASGETVADCAEKLSRLADDDGITGFMYGAAVSMLAKCWKHGEELRRWHNKETQIGTEGDEANKSGGVLNPALLSIGHADGDAS